MRIALSMIVGLLLTGAAVAQDMPLHEILKPGETWIPLDKVLYRAKVVNNEPYEVVLDKKAVRRNGVVYPLPIEEPTCSAVAVARWRGRRRR